MTRGTEMREKTPRRIIEAILLGGLVVAYAIAFFTPAKAQTSPTVAPYQAPWAGYGGLIQNQAFSLTFPDATDGHAHVARPADPFPFYCVSGCAAASGTGSNGSDAQATSAANGQAVSWLYAFNGSTWDRLRDDGSFNLKVNCVVGCAVAAAASPANNPTAQVTVTASSTTLIAARSARVFLVITNGATAEFIGPCPVTTTTGLPLAAGASLGVVSAAAWCGITASGSSLNGTLETF